MIGDHNYAKTDESLLSPLLEQRIIPPLLKATPWGVPANFITIASNTIWYVLAVIVGRVQEGFSPDIFVLVAVGIFVYIVGDFLDGEQAKRTGTRSPLGDFLDHYLDSFNNGVLIFMLMRFFDVSSLNLYALYLTLSYIGGTALVYEQFHRGILYFGKVGTTEGLFLAIAILLVASIQPVWAFLTTPAIGGISWFAFIFLILSVGGYLPTIFGALRRSGTITIQFAAFLVSMVVIGTAGTAVLTPLSIIVITTLYAGVYIGRLHRARVLKRREPFPDLVSPFVLMTAFVPDLASGAVILVVVAYLALQAVWITGSTIFTLRQFWIWTNPPQPEGVLDEIN